MPRLGPRVLDHLIQVDEALTVRVFSSNLRDNEFHLRNECHRAVPAKEIMDARLVRLPVVLIAGRRRGPCVEEIKLMLEILLRTKVTHNKEHIAADVEV